MGKSQNWGRKSTSFSGSYNTLVGWSRTWRSNVAMRSARWKASTSTRSFAKALMDPSCSSGSALVANTSKQNPSRSLSRCLLKPLKGIVNLASGQVLGTFASDCSVVRPPASGSPATSSLVWPDMCLSRALGSTPFVSFPNSSYASSNLSRSEPIFTAEVWVRVRTVAARFWRALSVHFHVSSGPRGFI